MESGSDLDVFVSYAHKDNEVAEGASFGHGWVTTLARNLNAGPGVLPKNVFIDHRLMPGDDFAAELYDKLERSALLLVLLSPNYVKSPWCGREIEHFLRTHGEDTPDVFVVELCPFESLKRVPEPLQALRRRVLHAKFWYQPLEAPLPLVAGMPSPRETEAVGAAHYWRTLAELRGAIDLRLDARRERLARAAVAVPAQAAGAAPAAPTAPPAGVPAVPPASAQPAAPGTAPAATSEAASPAVAVPQMQPLPPGPIARPVLGTVLLADTAEDLQATRTAMRMALQPEGILVLPVVDYVNLSPKEFDDALQTDLARADLFVQLLSPTVGSRPEGFKAPQPQLQFDRAVAAGLPIMQWSKQLPAAGAIPDAGHARLFDTPFLRVTHLADFEATVVARLRALKAGRERNAAAAMPAASNEAVAPVQAATAQAPLADAPVAAAPAAGGAMSAPAAARVPAGPGGQRVIFFDDVAGDPATSERLRALARTHGWDLRTLPPGAPLGGGGVDLKEALRHCKAGITVYTDPARHAAAHSRLVFCINQVADGGLPLERWGVLLKQGSVTDLLGVEIDEVIPLDEAALERFLAAM